MAQTIRIKRRAAGGASGAPSSLKNAELAYNEQDNSLYYGFGDAGGGTASSVITIGGRGAFADLTTTQTIAGAKTFSSTITGSISGNAGTATALATGRTISITGDLTYTSPSFDGTGNITAAGTLANSGVTAGTYTKITVDAKGRATVGATASHSDISAPTADVSWGNFKLTSLADPVNAQDAATKNYVDNVAQGLDAKASVKAATTAALAVSARTSTTLTIGGTTFTLDGVTLANADRVLVKDSTTGTGAGTQDNGIYTVGGIGTSVVLTRATDMDAWTEVPSAYTFIEQGTSYGDTGWVCTSNTGGTLGTTAITWAQFSSAGSGVASITFGTTGLTPSSATNGAITVAGTLVVGNGGTGATTFTSNGIIYGNGASALGVTAAGTWDATIGVGQLLSVNSSGVPTWTNTIDGGTF